MNPSPISQDVKPDPQLKELPVSYHIGPDELHEQPYCHPLFMNRQNTTYLYVIKFRSSGTECG